MPLLCMSRAVGTKIGESLGKLEEVDVANEGACWGRSLRLQVSLDLTQPLEQERTLLLGGKSIWVNFKYEQIPLFCFYFGRVLHGPKGCLVNLAGKVYNADGEKSWGPWLGAEDPRKKAWEGNSMGTREGWAPEKEDDLLPEKGAGYQSDYRETSMASSSSFRNPASSRLHWRKIGSHPNNKIGGEKKKRKRKGMICRNKKERKHISILKRF
jgi:hypothetical protein